MFLCQAAYYSTPETLTDGAVRDILKMSQEKNARLHVTGALASNGERFMQVLEGERSVVSRLLVRIAADPRHKDFVILGFRPIDERLFSAWSMAYVEPGAIHDWIVSRYSIDNKMRPEVMSYASVVSALRSLCE